MKYLYSLLWLCTVFFFSCNGGLPDAEETEGEIEIFPDYKGVAVPCNIAPLNFKLKEPCEAIALFSGCWTHRLEGTLRSGSIYAKMTDGFDILLFPFK